MASSEVSVSILGATGLLGPNGAGNTFMKCLRNSSSYFGKAPLLGSDIARAGRDIRTRVGYAPEQDCHIQAWSGVSMSPTAPNFRHALSGRPTTRS